MNIEELPEENSLLENGPHEVAIPIRERKHNVDYLLKLDKALLLNQLFPFISYVPELTSLRQTCRRMNTIIEHTENGRMARTALDKRPSGIRLWIFDNELPYAYICRAFIGILLGGFVAGFNLLVALACSDEPYSCQGFYGHTIGAAISGPILPTAGYGYLVSVRRTILLKEPEFVGVFLALLIAGGFSSMVYGNLTRCTANFQSSAYDNASSIVFGTVISIPFSLLAGRISKLCGKPLNRHIFFNRNVVNDTRNEIAEIRANLKSPPLNQNLEGNEVELMNNSLQ